MIAALCQNAGCHCHIHFSDAFTGLLPPCPICAAELQIPDPDRTTSVAPCPDSRFCDFTFLNPPSEPGDLGRFGNYRIIRLLGSGGMGYVFQARQPVLRRDVALKVMQRGQDPARFCREAELMAQLENDHLITIHLVERISDLPCIVMQLLTGQTLRDYLQRSSQPPLSETLRIGREIAEGLTAIHERGIIHRDIKPTNLWLSEKPLGRIILLDFGLARPGPCDRTDTVASAVMGSRGYTAPEQWDGMADYRSDLFSLGCILYEMLVGRQPGRPETAAADLASCQVPQPLKDLVIDLLRPDPNDRPATAVAVASRLREIERGYDAMAIMQAWVDRPTKWID